MTCNATNHPRTVAEIFDTILAGEAERARLEAAYPA